MTSSLYDISQGQKSVFTRYLSGDISGPPGFSIKDKLLERSRQMLKKISNSRSSKRNISPVTQLLSQNLKIKNATVQEIETDSHYEEFEQRNSHPKSSEPVRSIILAQKAKKDNIMIIRPVRSQPGNQIEKEKTRISTTNLSDYEYFKDKEKVKLILQKSKSGSRAFSPKPYSRCLGQSKSTLDFSIKPIERQISFSKQLDEKLNSYVWNTKPDASFSPSRQEVTRSSKRKSSSKISNCATHFISRIGLEPKKGSVERFVDFSNYVKKNIRNSSINIQTNASQGEEKIIARPQNLRKTSNQQSTQGHRAASLEILDKKFGLKESISTVISSPSNKLPLMKKKILEKQVKFIIYVTEFISKVFLK